MLGRAFGDSRGLGRVWRAAVAFVWAMAVAGGATTVATAQERGVAVDLELVLLADASGSIDDAEIMFQREGYVAALRTPELIEVLTSGPTGKVAIAYVEWGDLLSQDVVVDWMVIDGPETAEAFGVALLAAPRRAYGRNSIGAALIKAVAMLEQNGYDGERRVIDFSADSANNWNGPSIEEGREAAVSRGITINGLAVLCRVCSGRPNSYDLEAAFESQIIGGPGSFVVTADSRETFADAVLRKLFREATAQAPQPPSEARGAPDVKLAEASD